MGCTTALLASGRMGAERMVIIDPDGQHDVAELLAGLQDGSDAIFPDGQCGCGAYGRRAIESIYINDSDMAAGSEGAAAGEGPQPADRGGANPLQLQRGARNRRRIRSSTA